LMEWNDELNGRLAIIGAYFGDDVRSFVHGVVYEEFKNAGKRLEELLRSITGSADANLDDAAARAAQAHIDRLDILTYDLSFVMMVRLREGRVGRSAPDVLGEEHVRTILTKWRHP